MAQAVSDRPQVESDRPRNEGSLERRLTLAITLAPFLGMCVAVPLLWSRGISGLDLGLLIAGYFLAGFGVTVGYHRCFTHGSFRARPRVRLALALLGGMAIEGGVIAWVATHRRHHAMSDREGDPHSPHLEEKEGILGVLNGLWHAHIGWLFDNKDTPIPRYAPDMLADRTMVRIDRMFPLLTTASLVIPALIGLVVTRSLVGMLTAFLWGGLVRAFFVHHVTWSINSICHFYGNRPYDSKDLSTNNWPLAIISLGESWHNNHHAFPSSARHGIDRGQVDLSALVIRGLQWLGLAEDVKLPTDKQRELRRRLPAVETASAVR